MSTFGQVGETFGEPGGTFGGIAGDPAPVDRPRTRLALPVVVVQLDIDGVTHYFSDIEYGDPDATTGIGTRWHDARVVGDIQYSRAARCVLWGGRRGGGGGLGNIELINDDGALDTLTTEALIGAEARVYVVDQDRPMSEATRIATAVVERIEARGEQTVRIVTGDILARLDRPLQDDLYDAASDRPATLEGQPRPIAFGTPLSCPIVLVDEVDYEYDAHDSDAFDVTQVRDMGFPLTAVTQWQISTTPGVYGVELLQVPEGRVVADIDATSYVGEVIIGGSDGDFDSSSEFATWDTETVATASVSYGSSELIEMSAGQGGAYLIWPDTLTAGETYAVSVDVTITSVTGAPGNAGVQVFFRPDSLDPGEYVSIGLRTTAGSETMAGSFVPPSPGQLVIECIAVGDGTIEATIDNITLTRTAAGGDVADLVRMVLARAGIGADAIDATSIAALETARPWACGYFTAQAVQAADVLTQVMDSVYGWTYIQPDGKISVGYLQPPETGSAVLDITDTELAGEVEIEPDLADGLSTTVAGARNWYVYGPGELADAIGDTDRGLLTADFRIRRTAANPVGLELGPRAGRRVADDSRAGIPTLLIDEADIQAAADYLADLYPASAPRRFYRLPVFVSRTAAATLQPGDKITLTHDRFGADAALPLRVVEIEGRVGDDLVTITAWGSATT